MASICSIIEYIDRFLEIDQIKDYCPNGLQVDSGVFEVDESGVEKDVRIITAVSVNRELIDYAVSVGCDLIISHHGFFWKGEPAPLVGVKGGRIRMLMQNRISLCAYHLPLDIHPEIGNNILLLERLGLSHDGGFNRIGRYDGCLVGRFERPHSVSDFSEIISRQLGREPQVIDGGNGRDISRVAICTGAAQDYIEDAANAGVDAFISGEISERTPHLAKELGVHYFAAGHHATEIFGIEALGKHVSDKFAVKVEFANVGNPV